MNLDDNTEDKEAISKLEEKIKHLKKLSRLHKFLNQIRYPDITAGYINRLIDII